ncbi:hypothetical protein LCGC14_2847360, partial [marine sediment metagenome]
MLGNSLQISASVAVFAVLTVVAAAEQPAGQPVPRPGVLLLRNGLAVEGRIVRTGSLYYVELPHGEIRIKAADVEFCCRDLDEGYWRKRTGIRVGDADDHVRLAQWCLRHDLLGHAGRELADAIGADPTHPMIGLLQRRLKRAISLPPPPTSTATEAIDRPPSSEELDRMVRGMAPGTVEAFAHTIQPLLLNNCTAIGCHGPTGETKLRLMRGSINAAPSRRMTQRNLHATLQWIDHEQPMASRLLTAPGGPHGTAKTPILAGQRAAQYERLVDWVHTVAAARQTATRQTATRQTATDAAGAGSQDGTPADENVSGVVFYQEEADPRNARVQR